MTETETIFCSVPITTNIAEDRVRDLLCSAIEGGSNYWYTDASYRLRDDLSYQDFRECGSQTLADYFHPLELIPFVEGCAVIFEADMGDEIKTYELDRAAMERGIKLMAEKHPRHFQNFINEDDDSETGDVFLQLSLFGEVVFG